MAATGRKAHVPTDKHRELAKQLASFGMPHEQIAAVMQLSAPTLRKHYRSELDTGQIEANAKVAARLFQIATHRSHPNVTAMIFWLRTRAGWKETERVELSGRDGNAIEHTVAIVDEKKIAAALKRLDAEY